MSKLTFLDDVERYAHSVVTVGTFDGVHIGHQVLIQNVSSKANETDAKSVVVTFDPHPRDIINPGSDGIELLSTLEERCEILSDLGIDEMIVIPFNRDFSLLSSDQFLKDILWEKIGLSVLVIGYDHQFGRNREGTIETAQKLGEELKFETFVVSKQEIGDQTVSSTVIRNTLQKDGDVKKAADFLGRHYLLNGNVIHGEKRGSGLGFPTANIKPENGRKLIPKNGVYAVWIRVGKEYHKGVMNIGVRPTFKGTEKSLEVFILNFDKNIYGENIQIQFLDRIRNEASFRDVNELKNQILSDVESAKKIFNGESPNIAKQLK